MELVVNVYNICYSEENRLLKRSRTLREYSMFIFFVNECLDDKMSLEEAVAASVRRAKEEGILVDFLNKYATEVEGMLTGITVNEYGKVMKKEGFEDGKAAGLEQGRTEGLEQGLEQGRAAERLEMARNMKGKNYSVKEISELTGLTAEEIEKI